MEWLIILALAAWSIAQSRRITTLRRRVDAHDRDLLLLREHLRKEPAAEPLTAPVAAAPVPAPSVPPEPELLPSPVWREPEPPPQPPSERPERAPAARSAANWISENGLAWLGGGALALGGIFLVSYAAQRGVFTPALRIGAAVVLGLALIAIGEWLRRAPRSGLWSHPLAAAACAGAGAAILYGAFWAAYALFGFIGPGLAAALLLATSLSLLALALLHGQPLAVLAIGGAYIVPGVVGLSLWSREALPSFLTLALATGSLIAVQRRWGGLALATLFGGFAWALVLAVLAFEHPRFGSAPSLLVLLLAPLAAGAVMAERLHRDPGPRTRGQMAVGVATVAGAALAVLPLWWLPEPGSDRFFTPALVSAAIALVSAALVRREAAPGWVHALACGGAVLAALGALWWTQAAFPQRPAIAMALMSVPICVASAAASRRSAARLWLSGPGAAAALVLSSAAAAALGVLSEVMASGVAFAAALVFAACARGVAESGEDARQNLATAAWVAAGAVALVVGLIMAAPHRIEPAVLAAGALVLAVLHDRLGWRGLAGSGAFAGGVALTATVAPSFAGQALAGRIGMAEVAVAAGAAALLLAGAARIAQRSERSPAAADALDTAAIVVACTGVFLLLHGWLVRDAGAGADRLLDASLRSAVLLGAGLAAATAASQGRSVLARLRGQVLLGAGALHAAVLQGAALNPWWGGETPVVSGPFLLNTLTPAFLLPALMLAAAARRTDQRGSAAEPRLYALAAVGFAVMWAVLEIRRAFHGPDLPGGGILRAEAAAYAVLLLAVTYALAREGPRLAARLRSGARLAEDLAALARGGAAVALGASVLAFGWWTSPWWGPIARPLAGPAAAVGFAALYLAAAAFALGHARWWASRIPELSRAALAVAVGHLFVLATLAVRWGFRGEAMAPTPDDARVETWVYSAVWALYGVAVTAAGAARHNPTLRWCGLAVLLLATAKVFLFDTARLEGAYRAASFLAFGALLLAGAVYARRARAGRRAEVSAPASP